jgi:hypothetical protein
MKNKPGISKDKAFEMSRKAATNQYKEILIDLIKGTRNLKQNEIRVVYLDKNHPPNSGIESAVKIIDEKMPQGVEYSKVYLVPEILQGQVNNYPFSYQFFAQAFSNGFNRKDHPTLDNSDLPKLFAIQLMFMNMNRNFNFNNQFMITQGLNDILRVPMTNENLEIPDEFNATLDKVLKDVPKRDMIAQDNQNLL